MATAIWLHTTIPTKSSSGGEDLHCLPLCHMHRHARPMLLALGIGHSGTPPAKREEVTGYKKRVELPVKITDSNRAGAPGTFTLTVFTLFQQQQVHGE